MLMHHAQAYHVTISSALPGAVLEERLPQLAGDAPFRVQELTPLGGTTWRFTLQPARPGLAVGFGKVAELLVRLSRELDVHSVERGASRALAAAS